MACGFTSVLAGLLDAALGAVFEALAAVAAGFGAGLAGAVVVAGVDVCLAADSAFCTAFVDGAVACPLVAGLAPACCCRALSALV